MVSALIGAPSEAERDAGTLELLRYGLSLYSRERVVREDEVLERVAIIDRDVTVPLVAARGVTLTLRKDEDVEVRPEGVPIEVEGPVSEGDGSGRSSSRSTAPARPGCRSSPPAPPTRRA